MIEKAPQRGQGQGRGGGRQGQGGWKFCVCPKCKTTATKTRGTPCLRKKCSKCSTPMVGSNTRGKVSNKDLLENIEEACGEISKK